MMRFVFKICLLGPPAVGKTSLVLRYVKDFFKNDYLTTLGADFLIKELVMDKFDTKIKLCIWDIGGQSRWETLRPVYLQGADGAILVFDLTKRSTFQQLPKWIMDLETYAGHDFTPYVIVGNKLDLCTEELELREVPSEALEQFGMEQKKFAFETSAKSGDGIEQMFVRLALEVLKEKAQKEKIRKTLQDRLVDIMEELNIPDAD